MRRPWIGIEKITDRIAADTAAEIAAVQQQTQEAAAAIAEHYALEAEQAANDILSRGKRAAEEKAAQMLSGAELRAKKERLAVKQELLSEAFALALKRLCELPEDAYISLVAKLAADAASTGEESLVLSPADRSQYGKKIVSQANALLKAVESTPSSHWTRKPVLCVAACASNLVKSRITARWRPLCI